MGCVVFCEKHACTTGRRKTGAGWLKRLAGIVFRYCWRCIYVLARLGRAAGRGGFGQTVQITSVLAHAQRQWYWCPRKGRSAATTLAATPITLMLCGKRGARVFFLPLNRKRHLFKTDSNGSYALLSRHSKLHLSFIIRLYSFTLTDATVTQELII